MGTPSLLSPQQFAAKVRAKYPDVYDALDDNELTERVLSKYPQYAGQVQLATTGAAQPQVAIEQTPRSRTESVLAGLTEGPTGETGNVRNPKLEVALKGEDPTGKTGAMIGAAAAGGVVGPALPYIRPAVQQAGRWVAQNPIKSMLALEGAKLAAHGTAAEPYVNKIPTWLPLLASEGSGLAGLARHKLGLPPTAAAEAAAEAEAGAASRVAPSAPAITRAEVEQQLNQSLGGTPLQRGVPLRQQPGFPGASAQAEATTAAIPRDFTPVKSSAIRAYKYDPVRKEFESITTDGQHYVHSDISPADVTEFEASTSKGAAWGKLKSLGVLTAKVVGGKRVPVRPISLRSSEAIRNALSKKNR